VKSKIECNIHIEMKRKIVLGIFYFLQRLSRLNLIMLIFLISSLGLSLHAKIRLFTFHYNRPDFLELQHKTLQKFLKEKDDYELIVFNDARDIELKKKIELTCENLGIQCINFPQHLHDNAENGSYRHCHLVQYALENFGYEHDDIVGIMEGDVFLIRDFSIRETLKNYNIVAAMQQSVNNKDLEYIWIGLSFLDMKNLPNKHSLNFSWAYYNGAFLDSGGNTYHYLKNNPNVAIEKYFRIPIASLPREDAQQLHQLGFTQQEISFLKKMSGYEAEHIYISAEFHLDKHFLHYSWSRNANDINAKSLAFNDFLNDILIG
jgi:hypothetical protein